MLWERHEKQLNALLKVNWDYPFEDASQRQEFRQLGAKFKQIEELVKDYGVEGVLLTEGQKAGIEAGYRRFFEKGK